MATVEGEPKISKRAAEKEAKKAAAKAAKEKAKAEAPARAPQPSNAPPAAPTDPFRQGWLKGVYDEKPVPGRDVHTRFPPEPNGYLHIGHAKAITVNFGFARSHGGVCNLRFDDTNPSKEEEVFFTAIRDMVGWLGFEPAKVTYSSDEFGKLYELAEELIGRGKGPDEVKRGRGKLGGGEFGERSACAHWGRSVEENLREFRKMRDGGYAPGEAVLRMKQYLATSPSEYEISDEDSPEAKKAKEKLKALATNPALWDCAAYRVTKNSHHHRTGDQWRIYPTYEFTHCICDALEGISHSLCTVEFETLRPAYNWLLEALGMKVAGSEEEGPMQREYGRLNVEGTILSKRRIAMLVEGTTVSDAPGPANGASADGLADEIDELTLAEDGDEEPDLPSTAPNPASTRHIAPAVMSWDDPRLFTLVALRRRGVPPGALKKFVLDLGVTKANANTATHTLDAHIRTYLERTVPRLMLVLDPIRVTLTNLEDDYVEERDVPFDPKDPAKGTHKLPFTKTLYIDRDDFRPDAAADPDFFRLAPGTSVGLLHVAHPLRCTAFTTDPATGKVTAIEAEYGAHVPPGRARIHWVADSPAHDSPVKAEVRVFNPLFRNPAPNSLDWKTGGYHDDLNPESLVTYPDAVIECGFEEIKARAPWPREQGEGKGGKAGNEGVRFQGLRTAFFTLDKEATAGKVILNRIVSLREDGGKK
ncbi:Glutaminyl-tRNA synthetase [Teratosphaeriaceae sp. CCFEE 6253]|nr:Glutaminyl-tRNA synthetase [Teratosphaeriaceae sp. CCFEE 6253]